MHPDIPEEYLVEHYPSPAERAADFWIHGVALAAAALGGTALVVAAAFTAQTTLIAAAAIYAVALVTMLASSAAYNLTRISPFRPFLRRLDECAIFLMIAGSYTPFTSLRLPGAWAPVMTVLVWTLAALGIAGKLLPLRISERTWTIGYVAFGWVAAIALGPMIHTVPLTALALLVVGGLLYTTGTLVFLQPRLPYRRAIWHGFVAVAAATHYVAVLVGVVLAGQTI